jgi:hypothetical protein
MKNNVIVFQTHFVYIADQLQLFMNKLKKRSCGHFGKNHYTLNVIIALPSPFKAQGFGVSYIRSELMAEGNRAGWGEV